jgi:hypothetical protein
MKLLGSSGVVKMAILALLVTLTMSVDTFGQGRGRRAGKGLDKKCDKFVNCHDARDGRWDGRGPQRRLSSDDRLFGRNRRDRRFDDDDFRYRRNRRFDDDDFRYRRNRRFDDDDSRWISLRDRRERRFLRDNYYRGRRRF